MQFKTFHLNVTAQSFVMIKKCVCCYFRQRLLTTSSLKSGKTSSLKKMHPSLLKVNNCNKHSQFAKYKQNTLFVKKSIVKIISPYNKFHHFLTKLSSFKWGEQSQHIWSTSDENYGIWNRIFLIIYLDSLLQRDPINWSELRIWVGEPRPHRAHSLNLISATGKLYWLKIVFLKDLNWRLK